MTNNQEFDHYLAAIIETANYLRTVAEIPEQADFRDELMEKIKDAESILDDAGDMVNEFDLSEWED